ncbi:MAG TPA: FAD-dependent monooxygenase [Roseiflexaceae bacterium]|nr:FAD-dependent monooxygenase [Roseiflexaceae bacterium]
MQTAAPDTTGRPYGHAIVIGGSIAGLLAARVLSEHFAQVTLVERDDPHEQGEHRKGVPQARHPHALLLRGQREMEALLPGLTDELRAQGVEDANLGEHFRHFLYTDTRIPYESIYTVLCVSRPLLEQTVRRRVLDIDNVVLRPRTQAVELVANAEGTAVTGVRVRSIGGHELGEITVLEGDLVLDASGRDSRAPEWLAALGYEPPKEIEISADVSYTSRLYRRPADAPRDIKLLSIQPQAPGIPRGAVMTLLEGDRWHLTLIGMVGDHAPTDEEGYLEFIRSLSTPILYDLVKDAEPLSPIVGYRRAENRDRRYGELPRFLEGFAVMGDAAMALNPIYGQGMTVAALSAGVLAQSIRAHREQTAGAGLVGFAKSFQTGLSEAIAGAWQMAANEDQRWIDLRDDRPSDPGAALMQRYVGQVLNASLTMPAVAEAFFGVLQMIAPPTDFFRPDIVLQVMATLPTAE